MPAARWASGARSGSVRPYAAAPRKATTKSLYAIFLTSHVIAQPMASITLDESPYRP